MIWSFEIKTPTVCGDIISTKFPTVHGKECHSMRMLGCSVLLLEIDNQELSKSLNQALCASDSSLAAKSQCFQRIRLCSPPVKRLSSDPWKHIFPPAMIVAWCCNGPHHTPAVVLIIYSMSHIQYSARAHKADMSTWSSRDFIRVDKVLYVRCTETQLGIHAEKDL